MVKLKYFFEIKLVVVNYYLFGKDGEQSIVDFFGIERIFVCCWVRVWQFYGVEGLIVKNNYYFDEFKFVVVWVVISDCLMMCEVVVWFNFFVEIFVWCWFDVYNDVGVEGFLNI